ncbi:MAG: thioredoxin domain-containing protein [Acidobacteriia bacterium]|nr:thioredoxin domain-containing protein [Terriglobia bacterium]
MSLNRTFAQILLISLLSLTASARHTPAQSPQGKDPATSTKPAPTAAAAPASQTKPKPDSLEARLEQYLRNLYAWGPTFDLKIGTPKPSLIPDLLEVPVTVGTDGQSDTATVYVDKTGKFLVRGELTDMTIDPFADIRSKLHIGNSPSIGPENAKITLIEFADFECPSCRALDTILRDLIASNPDVRLVYKDFPLTNLHPWAMTAAIAARCTYQQNPAAFWKIHNAIFDAQDLITPSNVWDKLTDMASQQGLNMDTYRTCMAAPETKSQIEASITEGHALNITATPTTFINARRVVGPDQPQIHQYIQFTKSIY